jgi:hypothetical protein
MLHSDLIPEIGLRRGLVRSMKGLRSISAPSGVLPAERSSPTHSGVISELALLCLPPLCPACSWATATFLRFAGDIVLLRAVIETTFFPLSFAHRAR